ncbi:MBL fold metallo-hydrolase [Tenacibaculum agarivorans]|uniref:MBL fold metallo-hydrolase n=1 Tax=Tenacibaculum agarivorans TaxID=1908389 RepID=UPI00094BB7F5|nr:MBL fold metallo-hydrolase [Tenacibaculum agarivorans]
MKIEQIYTNCLSQGTYYIESNGEVAVIDPLREVQTYIDKAEKENAKIKYIFETHFHADFVSGHITLAEKTGATIVYGPTAQTSFDSYIAKDNESFKVGNIEIIALHTPGHTMESTTYLIKDEEGKNHAIFSGDTLFIGDVGRPDLAQKGDITQEDLAGYLYDSLREKIMILEDDVVVYPAHGAGSACGKHLSKETVSTIGDQKKTNYALRANMTKEEFIKEVTDGLLPPPDYFPLNVKLNKEGYESIDKIIQKGTKALDVHEFESLANSYGALVLDVRHQNDFIKGFIPQSIFIGLNGTFAPWVGALIKNTEQPILLVTPEGKEEETVTRLARVGFDNVLGYLNGSFEAWKNSEKEIDSILSISAEALEAALNNKATVFDVRKPGEYEKDHIKNVENTPLDYINQYISVFPKSLSFHLHCAGGYRSVIAASILKARGFHNVIDVAGGYKAIKETNIKRVQSVCTSS